MSGDCSSTGRIPDALDVYDAAFVIAGFGLVVACGITAAVFNIIDMPVTAGAWPILVASMVTGLVAWWSITILWAKKNQSGKQVKTGGGRMMSRTVYRSHGIDVTDREIVADDFEWQKCRHKMEGECGPFTISIYTDSNRDYSRHPQILWAVRHHSTYLVNKYATDYQEALQEALRVVNHQLSIERNADAFFQSMTGITDTEQPVDGRELQLSRGPEVLRRYLDREPVQA